MEDDFEAIAEFASPAEAELAAGRLEAEGIDTRLENRGVLGTSWLNPGHHGGLVVLVKSEDAEVARVLLDTIEYDHEPEVPAEYAADAEELECPECGSTQKKFRREPPGAFVIRLGRGFRGFKGHRWQCRKCDRIWLVEQDSDL